MNSKGYIEISKDDIKAFRQESKVMSGEERIARLQEEIIGVLRKSNASIDDAECAFMNILEGLKNAAEMMACRMSLSELIEREGLDAYNL